MALPQKHTVNANVQVRGGAARVVALSEAREFHQQDDGRTADQVLETAEKFANFLEGTEENAGANDE